MDDSTPAPATLPKPAPLRTDWRATASAAAFVVLWSSGYPMGKIAVAHAGPFTALVWRFGCAACVFGLLALGARVAWPAPRQVLHSAAVGVLSLALQFGGVYAGLRLGVSAGIAALIIGAMPIVTSLLAAATGERIRVAQWGGLAIAFVGVTLVLGERLGVAGAGAAGYVAMFIGLAGISLGTLYQKRLGSQVDLRVGLLIQHAVATLVLLPFALLIEGLQADWSPAFDIALAWMVLVNSVGTFALLFALLRRGAATRVAALFYWMPPVTALLGYLVLGEHLSLTAVPGFALVAAGVWLATREPRKLKSYGGDQ